MPVDYSGLRPVGDFRVSKSKDSILYTEVEVRSLLGDLCSEFLCEDGIYYKRDDIKVIELHNWFEENKKK